MQRVHLVELEDLPWLPKPIRDGGTDVLDFMFARMGFYRALVPELAALMEATGTRRLVDLCSGGGGGAIAMRALLREQGHDGFELVLTDRYPNAATAERVTALGDPDVHWRAEPVDAFDVPPSLRDGIRTMWSALHHFRPEGVRQLVQAAVDDRVPLAFFDVAAPPALRKLPGVVVPLLAIPNMLVLFTACVLMVPFVRPFRLGRALLTLPLPAIPLLYAWDGMVSGLRAYTPEELLELAHAVRGSEGYEWKATRGGPALCLLGRPKP
ncbi:hypothetical protein [Paraliomyxa miuraensis]|uniref:hypothetical protein n=1 Tax=Paraliomyxa miuraensis TaxID=376150 RepID=UPI0022516191|nr:hypothetical protein [Paraliomyxa miuraensis]MCX4240796.1 hypothetical protein [Paraliomyxa miuraensis]